MAYRDRMFRRLGRARGLGAQPIAGRLVPLGAQLGARNAFAVRGGSNHEDGDALSFFFGRALSLREKSLGKTRLVTPA